MKLTVGAFGILLILGITILAAAGYMGGLISPDFLSECGPTPNSVCIVYGFLRDWQTLIAGCLALLAGIMTVSRMQMQIDNQKEQHDEAAEINQRAALAELPETLFRMESSIQKAIDKIMEGVMYQEEIPYELLYGIKFSASRIESAASGELLTISNLFPEWLRELGKFTGPESPDKDQLILLSVVIMRSIRRLQAYLKGNVGILEAPITEAETMTALRAALGSRASKLDVGRHESVVSRIKTNFKAPHLEFV